MCRYIYIYGGFLKKGCHQITHVNRVFHYKPSSYWGTSIYGEPHELEDFNPENSTAPCHFPSDAAPLRSKL